MPRRRRKRRTNQAAAAALDALLAFIARPAGATGPFAPPWRTGVYGRPVRVGLRRVVRALGVIVVEEPAGRSVVRR